jgi:hypothetical protein
MPRPKKPVGPVDVVVNTLPPKELITDTNYEDFFYHYKKETISLSDTHEIEVETFYQLIKQRLINDLRVNTRSPSTLSRLIDEYR